MGAGGQGGFEGEESGGIICKELGGSKEGKGDEKERQEKRNQLILH